MEHLASHHTNSSSITGTNLERARARNRRVVLEAIRQAGQLTRAELSRLTSLTAQTISSIASELLSEGTLLAHAPASIPRGQPPVPLSLNPDGAFAIGFHLDGHQICGALTDLLGATRATQTVEVNRSDFTTASPALVDATRALRDEAAGRPVLGVGVSVGLPATADNAAPAPGKTAASGWHDVLNLTELEIQVEAPVLVQKPTTAALMGERLYGPATTLHSFVYLFAGRRLSAGLYLGGHVYDGGQHGAGHIGHLAVVPSGRLCRCGRQGCLEQYVSGFSLLRRLGLDPDAGSAWPDVASAKFHQRFEGWLSEAIPALRQAVDVLEQLLDPELVLLGGTLPSTVLEPLLARAFPPAIERSTPDSPPRPHLQLGNTGAASIARGAAAAVILGALSPDHEKVSLEPFR